MNDDPNAITSAELSDLADSLVEALSKSSGRDANRGIRATVQTVHEAEGTMEVIIDGDESSTVLPIESGAIGAQPGDRAYVKLEGREAYVASFRAKDATDRVRVLQEQIDDVVPEFDELNKSIEQGRRDMAQLKSEQDILKQETPTKVEVAQTIDKAKGEILTTIDGQYASEDDLKTLATKTEVELGLEGIRTEVSNTYMNKEDAANLATKTELQQTADSITLTAQGAMDKAEALEDDLTKNYATKSELSVESGRISGVVSDVTDIGQRTSTLEQTSAGFSVAITQAQQAADDAAKVATNYLDYSADNGLVIARQGATLDDNVQIKPGAVNIRSGETTNASFTSNKIALGINSQNSIIDLNDGKATIAYNPTQDTQAGIYRGTQINGSLGTSITHRGMPGQSSAFQVTNDGASILSSTNLAVQAPHMSFIVSTPASTSSRTSFQLGTNSTSDNVDVRIGNGELVGAWKDLDAQWVGTMARLGNLLNSWETAHWAPSDNLNNIKRSGIFLWQPATTGIPQANTWGVGLSLSNTLTASSGTWCMQLGMATNNDGKLWVRQSINNGAWTAWKQVGDNVAYTSHANSQKALGIYTGGVTLSAGTAAGWHQVWTKAQFNSKFAGYNPTNTSIYFMDHVGGNSSIVYDCMVDGNQTVWLRSRTDGGAYTGAVSARYQVIAGSNT